MATANWRRSWLGQPARGWYVMLQRVAGSLAAWTLARQGLLALRAEPRRWHPAAPVIAAAAALIADVIIAAV